MYEKLPKQLRDYPYFGLWKYEQKDGRRTKVPKTVRGYNANSKNLKQFCGLDEVADKVAEYDGICIALAGGLSAIDIDHCVENGKLSEMAAEIIDKVNSYTEYSPSGNGIRIIGKTDGFIYDQDKYYVNNRKLGLEVYASRNVGIITITGNAIREVPLRDFSDVLPEILEKYMKRPDAVTDRYPTDTPGSFLTDEEVIEKASAAGNGERFDALYNGDVTGYPSQSEAELAFMTILAFWCGGDTEQMERIYTGSKLYREKWNRADYRTSTLNKALRGVTDFYKPIPVSTAEEDFADPTFPEAPIPLEGRPVPVFPVEALPKDIADYVLAVSESTQTPVDVAACAALSVLSIGIQGKYVIRPKQALGLQRKIEDELDTLDVSDRHYDRKYESLNRRLEEAFDAMEEAEQKVADSEARLESIKKQKLTRDSVYESLKIFDKLYNKMNDYEKKKFVNSFIRSIELHPDKTRKNGNPVKVIHFRFPVAYNGESVYDVYPPQKKTDETVVLMSKVNTVKG